MARARSAAWGSLLDQRSRQRLSVWRDLPGPRRRGGPVARLYADTGNDAALHLGEIRAPSRRGCRTLFCSTTGL